MTRVLLIHPWNPELFPPPAIGYLRAALQQENPSIVVKSCYLDASGWPSDPVDFVGVSVHSFSVPHLPSLIQSLRLRYPKAWLIAGGHHPSALPQQMLDIGFDQVVVGQGESALTDIVFRGERSRIYRKENSTRILVPDYSDLDVGWTMPLGCGGRAIAVLSSRGCPFECGFCASSQFWARKWHPLTPDETLMSLEAQIRKYKLSAWMFEDDNFTLQRKRAIEICRAIKESPYTQFGRMPWHAASRAAVLQDEDLCRALKDAGCTHLWLGIESLSQKMLNLCKKQTKVESMIKGIQVASRVGLSCMCQFIVGLPGETEETIQETLVRLREAKPPNVGLNKAWILPGTDIHRKAREHGWTDDRFLQGVSFYECEWPPGTLDRWVSLLARG
jgi:anaerobic magnesium-protoporphyrin IX monomethyl ester cyclase